MLEKKPRLKFSIQHIHVTKFKIKVFNTYVLEISILKYFKYMGNAGFLKVRGQSRLFIPEFSTYN